MEPADLTIAIPTYNRGAILVSTISRLLAMPHPARSILIVDQTETHPDEVNQQLSAWAAAEKILWLRLTEPSIPHAMNVALEVATTPLVLFLDDDIEPLSDLAKEHADAHGEPSTWAVVGQILQPDEQEVFVSPRHAGRARLEDLDFAFSSSVGTFISNAMAGNLSVVRERVLSIGGFDENFIGAAYRFETDFAFRICEAGGAIWFEPRAGLRHLKLASGGLRSFGDHRRTASPAHSVGDYYFALQHADVKLWRYVAKRLAKNVATKYLLAHPWWIPSKLVGELRGFLEARRLHERGPRLIGWARTMKSPV